MSISEEEGGRLADEYEFRKLQSKSTKLINQIDEANNIGKYELARRLSKELSEVEEQMKKYLKDEDPKAELIKYAEATKDPDYIKHVKSMKNQASINARLQYHRQKESKEMKDSPELEAAQELFSAFKSQLTDGGPGSGIKGHKTSETPDFEVMSAEEFKKITGLTPEEYEKKYPSPKKEEKKKTSDAYDPKKYEGTREHRRNMLNLESTLESLRGRATLSKERITKLRHMVSSGKYWKATSGELKEEEREYENILMKIKQVRSMLQRMKGQKDSCATKDGYDFGDETMTTREAKEYWDEYHDSDPILMHYKTFEAWYRESKRNGYIKDGYNFEEPKVIEAVIKKLEKEAKEGKPVDPDYLAGVKRALEMAKKERATKDSMEMLKLMGFDTSTYQVVHRKGDFKVVQTNEGFEVYYLGIYHDTFSTKEQALSFISKYNKKGKA